MSRSSTSSSSTSSSSSSSSSASPSPDREIRRREKDRSPRREKRSQRDRDRRPVEKDKREREKRRHDSSDDDSRNRKTIKTEPVDEAEPVDNERNRRGGGRQRSPINDVEPVENERGRRSGRRRSPVDDIEPVENERGRRGGRQRSPVDRSSRGEKRRHYRSNGDERMNKSIKTEPVDETETPAAVQENVTRPNRKPEPNPLLTKAGGAYIPPAKLRQMQQQIEDKGSEMYQRLEWERLKKRIHGQINKANISNITQIVGELFGENLIRAKGIFARSVLQAQAFSPAFSNVYAALVAVINHKFPHIGELVVRRLLIQFKQSYKNKKKPVVLSASKFIAHLFNQDVIHEVIPLEILTLLLFTPTEDSTEIAIALLKECGAKLTESTPRGTNAIFERLRNILTESDVGARCRYIIEAAFAVRKDKFSAFPARVKELDLVEEEDQITHTMSLDEVHDPENGLNVFRLDPDFEKNEAMYEEIKQELYGVGDSSDSEGEDDEDADADAENEESEATQTIIDNTEAALVAFRRTLYLKMQSSLTADELVHKVLKSDIKPGMELEICHMILDCCAQRRTFEVYYASIAERFCRLKKEYQLHFEEIFRQSYDTIHRFTQSKLKITSKFFAFLLSTDAISWEVLSHIRLNEDDTTSSGRVYIKELFQSLVHSMQLEHLYARVRDPTLQTAFDGLFPRDNPRDTRFSINFFTAIGLGGLTVDLREHLKQ